jgi:hypothetical protein
VALEHKGELAGAEPGCRRGAKGDGTNGALSLDGLPEERGDLAGAEATHSGMDGRGHAGASFNLGALSRELRDFVALRLERLRDLVSLHRLSLPRLPENTLLVIVGAGASIVLAWLVTVVTYPGGGSLGGALAPTATRAITTAPVSPRPAHARRPRRTATPSPTATTTEAQPVPTNVVPVAGRRTPETSGTAANTTIRGSIQTASGDRSQTGRTDSAVSRSRASGSTNIGSTGPAGGSGFVGGGETRTSGTSATPPSGTGTVSGTGTTTSGSGTISGTDTTASGTGTASGGG